MKNIIRISCLALFLLSFADASAQGYLDDIQNSLTSRSAGVWAALIPYGISVFYALVVIDFAWSMISVFLNGEAPSTGDVIAELLRQVMVIGLFLLLVQNGWEYTGLIISSLLDAGAVASGDLIAPTPQAVFNAGIEFVKRAYGELGWFDTEGLGILIAAIILCVFCAMMGVAIVIVWVELALVLATGGLIAGLSGTRWTRDYAISYFKYSISVGVKLFLMLLIAGIVLTDVTDILNNGDAADLTDVMAAIGITVFGFFLLKSVPEVLSAVLQGVSIGNQGAQAISGSRSTAGAAMSAGSSIAGGAIGGGMAVAAAASYGKQVAGGQQSGSGSSGGGAILGASGKAFAAGAGALISQAATQGAKKMAGHRDTSFGSNSTRIAEGIDAKTESAKTQQLEKNDSGGGGSSSNSSYTSPAPDLDSITKGKT